MSNGHKPLRVVEKDTVSVERIVNGNECGEDCPCSYVNREDERSCILDGQELYCAWTQERGTIYTRSTRCLGTISLLTPPTDATRVVEIFSLVTCNTCKRAWIGYTGCLTEALPCGHMRSQWAIGGAVVDDMIAASCVRDKSMEEDDDDQ